MSNLVVRQVVVGATFTAEPIEPALAFWNAVLEWDAAVVMAPYNQLFQNVLDPNSPMRVNRAGVNLVLLRLVDWLDEQVDDREAQLRSRADDWVDALAAVPDSTPFVVCLCPPRPTDDMALLARIDKHVCARLATLPHVQLVAGDQLQEL